MNENLVKKDLRKCLNENISERANLKKVSDSKKLLVAVNITQYAGCLNYEELPTFYHDSKLYLELGEPFEFFSYRTLTVIANRSKGSWTEKFNQEGFDYYDLYEFITDLEKFSKMLDVEDSREVLYKTAEKLADVLSEKLELFELD